MTTIGIIGGSGLYDMAELTDREERTVDDAVRRAVGARTCIGDAARAARRVSGAARRRPPAAAVRAELPRQHLRLQGARRRVDPVGERGRQPARGLQAAGPGRCPISSSIARAAAISTFFGDGLVAHVGVRASVLRPAERRSPTTSAHGGRRHRAPRRHLRVHGRAAVLDAGRVERCIARGASTSSA